MVLFGKVLSSEKIRKYKTQRRPMCTKTRIVCLIILQCLLMVLFFIGGPKSSYFSRGSNSGSKSVGVFRGILGQKLNTHSDHSSNSRHSILSLTSLFHLNSDDKDSQAGEFNWMNQMRDAIGEKEGKEYVILQQNSASSKSDPAMMVQAEEIKWGSEEKRLFLAQWKRSNGWPPRNERSTHFERLNMQLPRNRDLYPKLPENKIIIVLYVHSRPNYLSIVLNALSKVSGINETLLIVSHDGQYEEMDALVQSIKFCQVKQIYAVYSPHNFDNMFPHISPNDCTGNVNSAKSKCIGQADGYGNFRNPHFISLKHHWWWMMNTVWNGLEETRNHNGYIVFIEEDHFVFPNAYRNLQLLIEHKSRVCPQCIAVNLAPSRVESNGDAFVGFVSEKMGNVGYAINRTLFNAIHLHASTFCNFDDYNWDLTLWQKILESWSDHFSLRWSRASAMHIGKCGLHQGHDPKNKTKICSNDGLSLPKLEARDLVPSIIPTSKLTNVAYKKFPASFRGFGGWGDWRDQELCRFFTFLYR